MMDALPWVAAGGALGALLRGALATAAQRFAARRGGHALIPLRAAATLMANGLGCFLLSLWLFGQAATEAVDPATGSPGLHALITTGLCGGLTTFSTVCGDAHRFWHVSARPHRAFLYLALTGIIGLIGFHLGTLLGPALPR